MQSYQLLNKGQTNIDLTTNQVLATNTIKVYKLYDDVNGVNMLDITEAAPVITVIGGGTLARYTFTAPTTDCYILTLFNGYPRFFRVGSPTLRIWSYFELPGKVVPYTLLNFDGTTDSSGNMVELGLGVYYITPTTVGDYIFTTGLHAPIPVHTPYVVDNVGMSGTIIFQKDQWMLCALPKLNYRISDMVADIEAKYGVPGNSIFQIFSAYPSTDTQSRETLDYKPGVTPIGSKYDFTLVYTDGTINEISGFWIKTLPYDLAALGVGTATELVTYEWVT